MQINYDSLNKLAQNLENERLNHAQDDRETALDRNTVKTEKLSQGEITPFFSTLEISEILGQDASIYTKQQLVYLQLAILEMRIQEELTKGNLRSALMMAIRGIAIANNDGAFYLEAVKHL